AMHFSRRAVRLCSRRVSRARRRAVRRSAARERACRRLLFRGGRGAPPSGAGAVYLSGTAGGCSAGCSKETEEEPSSVWFWEGSSLGGSLYMINSFRCRENGGGAG